MRLSKTLNYVSRALNIEIKLIARLKILFDSSINTNCVPFLVDRSATRIYNFLRNIRRYGSLKIEEGCSHSSMVHQGDGRTNQSPDSIHKDLVPSPTSIFWNALDIYICITKDNTNLFDLLNLGKFVFKEEL